MKKLFFKKTSLSTPLKMLNKLIFIIRLVIFFTAYVQTNTISTKLTNPLIPSESYTHKLDVDQDQIGLYTLFWKLVDNGEILFEVHCNTSGWVGLGISLNGGMQGEKPKSQPSIIKILFQKTFIL